MVQQHWKIFFDILLEEANVIYFTFFWYLGLEKPPNYYIWWEWSCHEIMDTSKTRVDLLRFRGHSPDFRHLLLKRCWAEISQVLMASRPIIKHLNIIKYVCDTFWDDCKQEGRR